MSIHTILLIVQLFLSVYIMVLLFWVMRELVKLRHWIEWTRAWITRANERLKELEDWVNK